MANRRYRAGYDFERKVRDALYVEGALYVCRSAGSKGPVDLIAFRGRPAEGTYTARVWFVQAKRTGKLSKADRWALAELAHQCGALPVLARPGARGAPVVFEVLVREQEAA